MGIGNVVVLSQVTAFSVSFIVSFLLFVPIAVNVHEFGGNCLLYATGKWTNVSVVRTELSQIQWGPDSACGFNVFMGVVVMLLSLFYIVWESIYLIKQTDSSWLDAFVTSIVCLVVTLLLFASSLTLSVGFHRWCELILSSSSQIESCQLGDFITFTENPNIYTKNYYTEMAMAQFGAWVCWLCWLVLTVLAFSKVIGYHRQEAIQTSMNRERQRLLQRVGHQAPVAI